MSSRRALLDALDESYVSANCRAGLIARIAPTLAFYSRVTPVVLRNAARGQDGYFTAPAWRDSAGQVARSFEKCGVPIIIENLEVFERLEEPCVIIGNHMSTTETFVLAAWLLRYRPITYVVKQALVEYPIFKHIMRSCDPVVVGRKDARADLKAVLEGGAERLRRGISPIIFPQKTRKVKFVPEEFNSIGIKLARRAKVPVVPLAVKTDAWANGTMLKDFGPFQNDKPVHIAFGEPLTITGNGREQNDAVISFIQDHLARWQEWDARWRAAK